MPNILIIRKALLLISIVDSDQYPLRHRASPSQLAKQIVLGKLVSTIQPFPKKTSNCSGKLDLSRNPPKKTGCYFLVQFRPFFNKKITDIKPCV